MSLHFILALTMLLDQTRNVKCPSMLHLLFSYNSYLFFLLPAFVPTVLISQLGDYKRSRFVKKVAVNDISLPAAVTNYTPVRWRFRFLRRFVISRTRNSSRWLRIILRRDIQPSLIIPGAQVFLGYRMMYTSCAF